MSCRNLLYRQRLQRCRRVGAGRIRRLNDGFVSRIRGWSCRRWAFDSDPLFFGNSLAMELESAERVHRFTRDEIRQLMLSSIEATWLSAERKKRLAADFQRDPSWNEAGA